jgi:hypothetical protein
VDVAQEGVNHSNICVMRLNECVSLLVLNKCFYTE